ncbi:uncharacterized protein [Rutidosis leptorrhynchoides]|uniref:uncharacterized protein n=1 Tax=Rutidosis leptorrhynchoides TaxID=125765 RepID=UPI003A9A5BB9
MAILQPPSLHLSNPFSTSPRATLYLHKVQFPLPRASSSDNPEPEPPSEESSSDDQFENRLSQIRVRYRSGSGKKAEQRKEKKGKKSEKSKSGGSGMYLPPVALKEAMSSLDDGLKVEFGFSPYSERLNGRIAILGLSALLLVELATGKSVINYHSPSIIFTQIYFVAAVTALFVKFEKEKVSVWPDQSK